MTDSCRSLKFWAQESRSGQEGASSGCSAGLMNLKGSVVRMKSLSQASETRVFWLRSIMRSRNLRRFSSRREEEPIFFMRTEVGRRLASSSAIRYSLQLGVFFLRQGWKPKMISQRQVPREKMSLLSLGRNLRDLSFSGGMQEIVPLRVVLSLHSASISDTPKSHNLNSRPRFRMFTGLMSSCTMPASSRAMSPLLSWQKRSQISSSDMAEPSFSVRMFMRVPPSQYSWKMQRWLPESRYCLWVRTRQGQGGRFWMMRSSFRYQRRTSSLSILITFTANTRDGLRMFTARYTFAYLPSPIGISPNAYRSSSPVSSLRRVTTFTFSSIASAANKLNSHYLFIVFQPYVRDQEQPHPVLRPQEELRCSGIRACGQGSPESQRFPHRAARTPVPQGQGPRAHPPPRPQALPELGHPHPCERWRLRLADLCHQAGAVQGRGGILPEVCQRD